MHSFPHVLRYVLLTPKSYTESLFALLSFLGLVELSKDRPLVASLWFSMAGACRSNALLYCGFFLWRLLVFTPGSQVLVSAAFGKRAAAAVCHPSRSSWQWMKVHNAIYLLLSSLTHPPSGADN